MKLTTEFGHWARLQNRFSLQGDVYPYLMELAPLYGRRGNDPKVRASARCKLERLRDLEGLVFCANETQHTEDRGRYRWRFGTQSKRYDVASAALNSNFTRDVFRRPSVMTLVAKMKQRAQQSAAPPPTLDQAEAAHKRPNGFVPDVVATTSSSVKRARLPNLIYPNIKPVRADLFDIDITEGRQRDPERRKKKLIKQFGLNGEKFDFERFEVITAVPRSNGRFFPSGGMGRIWAVINLLKRPDLEIPTLVARASGDQIEKRGFVHSQTNSTPIKKAELFMTYGHMDGVAFSAHREIVRELNTLGLTTVPGSGYKSVTHSAAIFCGRLGTLTRSYTVARDWWFKETTAVGIYKHKVEGSAMSALGAFFYAFDGSGRLDWDRLRDKFAGVDYEQFKRDACEKFTDSNSDQGRDDAPAVVRFMIYKYNLALPANDPRRLDYADLLALREDFASDEFWTDMHDAWRMKDKSDK